MPGIYNEYNVDMATIEHPKPDLAPKLALQDYPPSMPEVGAIVFLVIDPAPHWRVIPLLHRIVSVRVVWRRRIGIAVITRLILVEAVRRI